jgi:hypothetical protein
VGESALALSHVRRNSSMVSRILNQPLLGLIDHLHELADYFFVCVVDAQKLIVRKIAVVKREFQMNLRFRGFTFCIAKFAINAASYRRFRHASAIFAQTDRDDRRA